MDKKDFILKSKKMIKRDNLFSKFGDVAITLGNYRRLKTNQFKVDGLGGETLKVENTFQDVGDGFGVFYTKNADFIGRFIKFRISQDGKISKILIQFKKETKTKKNLYSENETGCILLCPTEEIVPADFEIMNSPIEAGELLANDENFNEWHYRLNCLKSPTFSGSDAFRNKTSRTSSQMLVIPSKTKQIRVNPIYKDLGIFTIYKMPSNLAVGLNSDELDIVFCDSVGVGIIEIPKTSEVLGLLNVDFDGDILKIYQNLKPTQGNNLDSNFIKNEIDSFCNNFNSKKLNENNLFSFSDYFLEMLGFFNSQAKILYNSGAIDFDDFRYLLNIQEILIFSKKKENVINSLFTFISRFDAGFLARFEKIIKKNYSQDEFLNNFKTMGGVVKFLEKKEMKKSQKIYNKNSKKWVMLQPFHASLLLNYFLMKKHDQKVIYFSIDKKILKIESTEEITGIFCELYNLKNENPSIDFKKLKEEFYKEDAHAKRFLLSWLFFDRFSYFCPSMLT